MKTHIPSKLRSLFNPIEWEYTYTSYRAMRQRCNPINNDFKYYKDIKITDQWLGDDGFKNFASDMGKRPLGLTLERVNNQGNYCKDNCKWATRYEQGQNTRKKLNQANQDIKKMCTDNGITFHSVEERARFRKITLIDAFNFCLKNKKLADKNIKLFGYKTLAELSRSSNVCYASLHRRIKCGENAQQAIENIKKQNGFKLNKSIKR